MIGIPRITLIRPALNLDRMRTLETRSGAQNSPRMVDRISEPMVTMMVSHTPCSRIGRNSVASRRKFCIDSNYALHLAWLRLKCDPAPLFVADRSQLACGLRPHLPRILSAGALAASLGGES